MLNNWGNNSEILNQSDCLKHQDHWVNIIFCILLVHILLLVLLWLLLLISKLSTSYHKFVYFFFVFFSLSRNCEKISWKLFWCWHYCICCRECWRGESPSYLWTTVGHTVYILSMASFFPKIIIKDIHLSVKFYLISTHFKLNYNIWEMVEK